MTDFTELKRRLLWRKGKLRRVSLKKIISISSPTASEFRNTPRVPNPVSNFSTIRYCTCRRPQTPSAIANPLPVPHAFNEISPALEDQSSQISRPSWFRKLPLPQFWYLMRARTKRPFRSAQRHTNTSPLNLQFLQV